MVAEHFDVTFDGPALEQHTMNVRDLAPALIALADAFQDAQGVLTPQSRRANLEINTTREGSFAVDLILNSNLAEQAADFLAGRGMTATANVGGLVGLVMLALEGIKWLGNRSYTAQPDQNGQIQITTASGDSITMPADSVRLIESGSFRRNTAQFVSPLTADGVTSVVMRSRGSGAIVRVDRDDLPAFGAPPIGETVVSDNTVQQVVTVDSVPFRETLLWRLNDGSASITATMNDRSFRDRIRRRAVQFGEGDKLRAEIRTVQTMDAAGLLTTRRSIERVIEHIPGPIQGSLFDPN